MLRKMSRFARLEIWMYVSPNEVYQYSERHDCSRKAPRAAHRDVPDGFYKPMASHVVRYGRGCG
jgi:hypothetical protein